jgi:serine protease inhibitor
MRRPTTRLAALLLAVAACRATTPTQPGGAGAALTGLPRQLTPAEQSVIDASNAFSFALFGTVSAARPGTDVFLSPLSASMSLGMALNGAADSTYDQMRAALQFGNATQHDIDAGYHSLIDLLAALDSHVQFQIANAIWYDRTLPVYQSFVDSAQVYFDATVGPLDFADAAASLSSINGWVNTQTKGRIPSIVDQIQQGDVMFLVNAIYFKGDWRDRFDPAQTEQASFTPTTGSPQQVALMRRTAVMSYAQTDAYQAVDLAYGDSAFTMTVLLPAPGESVDALTDSLTPQFWHALTASLHTQQVDLSLPKLQMSYGRQLNDDLIALGMRSAFVPGVADFTHMSSLGSQLYITYVKQKAYVRVDENGTEAAAATVTGVGLTSVQVPVTMRVDRPYLFVIRERLSGTLLFMGKVEQAPQS